MPLVTVVAVLFIVPAAGMAQDEPRLLDQEPFDQIVFKQPPDRIVKVLPLDLPSRRVPSNPRPTDKLQVRPWDNPAEPYEIAWRLIERVELFEQLLLKEAEALTAAGRLGEAYDYFVHLLRRYPDLPQRAGAFERFLFADAQQALEKNEHELALASLYELHQQNADFDGFGTLLTQAVDAGVNVLMSEKRYPAVRQFLDAVDDRIGKSDATLKWRGQLKAIADELLDEGRRQIEAGRLREGRERLRQSIFIWPSHEGARQLMADVHRRHPQVAIGVTQAAAEGASSMLVDWAWRRTNRLLYRRLFEPVGFGAEGGTYESPFAEVERRGFGLELSFLLAGGADPSSDNRSLTGYDLSRHLLMMADPASPVFEPAWADLVKSVWVQDVYRVDVELNRGHMLPTGLLQSIVVPPSAADVASDEPPTNGPFRVASRSSGEVVYEADPNYFAMTTSQPQTIVERSYTVSTEAIEALEQGKVSALDRVDLRYLDRLSENEQIVVDAYAAPTVHCLILTRRSPVLVNRVFRRALVYAIPRQRILESVLLGGRELSGCQVVSGPFPLGYAYDENIKPRPYDPRLAMSLIAVAFLQGAAAEGANEPAARGASKTPNANKSEALVLAHPASEPARLACEAIQSALARVGLEVTLEPYSSHAALSAEQVDLIYAELAMWEPLVDARRLFKPGGLVSYTSPYLELGLRRLDDVSDWREARERLLDIHRFVHQDVPIVPLWQILDRYARHRSLEGVGTHPVTLYQNVEAWQSTPPVLRGLQ